MDSGKDLRAEQRPDEVARQIGHDPDQRHLQAASEEPTNRDSLAIGRFSAQARLKQDSRSASPK